MEAGGYANDFGGRRKGRVDHNIASNSANPFPTERFVELELMGRDYQPSEDNIETYLYEHAGAEFSHGMCPECAQRLYPEYYEEEDKP